jgi:hypothetical protein
LWKQIWQLNVCLAVQVSKLCYGTVITRDVQWLSGFCGSGAGS